MLTFQRTCMKAVVWTDCFQIVVMFAGMLTLLISGSIKLGGLDVAWDVAYQNDRIKFFPCFELSIYSVVTLEISAILSSFTNERGSELLYS
jgi:Na+/proline symporter